MSIPRLTEIFEAAKEVFTGCIRSISNEHAKIHDGKHFFYGDIVTLAQDAVLNICIQTPASETIHLNYNMGSTLGTKIEVYEESDITYNGSDIVFENNNRLSTNASPLTNSETGSTINNVGTKLPSTIQLGSSTSPFQGLPGSGERKNELILKRSTSYIIRITSLNNSNVISYFMDLYY